MNRITHLSKHALKRLEQRSSLTGYELAQILDCCVFVEIGREPGFNRSHRLFFSQKDDAFYVVIQDAHTGSVVTILPPEYHEKISWKIKDDEFSAAKEIALAPPKAFKEYSYTESTHQPKPSTFVISAHFNDDEGRQKTKGVMKLDALQYHYDIAKLTKDQSFEKDVLRSLGAKGIDPEDVWAVSVRLGQSGTPIYFDWKLSALSLA